MEMSVRKNSLFSPPVSPIGTQDPSGSKRPFRPYTSLDHHVTKGRYITSNDPRGYIPVYEYPLHGQWIMMDMDDGYVLWTGIWKALGHSKADIVKMVESEPDLASRIRRVRGGYLKIQGTWMPYEVALRLSRRVAWHIRYDLVPLFGPTFPPTCLSPDQPGFGQIISGETRRRRTRRAQIPAQTTMSNNWIISHSMPTDLSHQQPPSHTAQRQQNKEDVVEHVSRRVSHDFEASDSSRSSVVQERTSPNSHRNSNSRWTPYQPTYPRARFFPSIVYGPHHYIDSGAIREPQEAPAPTTFMLPALQQRPGRTSVSLPSISDLVGFSDTERRETATIVLERLKSDQNDVNVQRQSYPGDKVLQRDEFPSALSPFCPLPQHQMQSSTNSALGALPALRVPSSAVHDPISPSSSTFSGSTTTGREVSPTTPDIVSDHDGRPRVSRSPLINGLDHWSTGQSQSPGRTIFHRDGPSAGCVGVIPGSPNHRKTSVPITTDSASITPDGSSPHFHLHRSAPANNTSRPLRPW